MGLAQVIALFGGVFLLMISYIFFEHDVNIFYVLDFIISLIPIIGIVFVLITFVISCVEPSYPGDEINYDILRSRLKDTKLNRFLWNTHKWKELKKE